MTCLWTLRGRPYVLCEAARVPPVSPSNNLREGSAAPSQMIASSPSISDHVFTVGGIPIFLEVDAGLDRSKPHSSTSVESA